MEAKVSDKALKSALGLAQPRGAALPTNFSYLAMQRIRREQQQRARRQRIAAWCGMVAVALLCLVSLVWVCGAEMWRASVEVLSGGVRQGVVLPMLFCFVFFVVLNHFLHRHYHHRI